MECEQAVTVFPAKTCVLLFHRHHGHAVLALAVLAQAEGFHRRVFLQRSLDAAAEHAGALAMNDVHLPELVEHGAVHAAEDSRRRPPDVSRQGAVLGGGSAAADRSGRRPGHPGAVTGRRIMRETLAGFGIRLQKNKILRFPGRKFIFFQEIFMTGELSS